LNNYIKRIIAQKSQCRILDIGGTEAYWELNEEFLVNNRENISIVLANIGESSAVGQKGLFRFVQGDALEKSTYDGDFDFIHSNSVIEHVGGWQQIRKMAGLIAASGKPYYVQTPNFWFPVEPHFRMIGYQWLPVDTRAKLLLRKPRGFRQASHYDGAVAEVESVQLLTKSQMRLLFPDADILEEKIGPLTKSFIAVKEY
jgi:hypothetical protein